MSWILAWPWAALGLLAVPALVAVYLLRQRSERRVVSSLLLWRGEPPLREGGRRVDRFTAPPLFWLELLILLLLVAAALGPLVPTPESRRPLVVVLDDSFSMRAGDPRAPREEARAALRGELRRERHLSLRLILAGSEARPLGEGVLDGGAAVAALNRWRAAAPTADLEDALALAFEVGGEQARLLVVTDQAPPSPITEPRLQWWAFGRPQANLAIVGASRRATDGAEDSTCLVEVANFSPADASSELGVSLDTRTETFSVLLAAGETGRFRFAVPAGETVRAELAGDALAFDDTAVLLPETGRPVRVAVAAGDPGLGELLRETLAATERAAIVGTVDDAEIVVSTAPADADDGRGAWWLELRAERQSAPYLGPFVVDRGHPLSDGLELGGVIWSAGRDADAGPGRAVVSAGDVPLVLDRERGGRHDLVMRFVPRLSNLQQTPNWPILWWNLLAWRAASAPGLERRNVRLEETVTVRLDPGEDEVLWRLPGGEERRVAAVAGVARLVPGEPGVHEVARGDVSERFAANVLAADESDLRQAAGGRWGDWDASAGGNVWGYRRVDWVFLLLALALLLVHLARTALRRRPQRSAA